MPRPRDGSGAILDIPSSTLNCVLRPRFFYIHTSVACAVGNHPMHVLPCADETNPRPQCRLVQFFLLRAGWNVFVACILILMKTHTSQPDCLLPLTCGLPPRLRRSFLAVPRMRCPWFRQHVPTRGYGCSPARWCLLASTLAWGWPSSPGPTTPAPCRMVRIWLFVNAILILLGSGVHQQASHLTDRGSTTNTLLQALGSCTSCIHCIIPA